MDWTTLHSDYLKKNSTCDGMKNKRLKRLYYFKNQLVRKVFKTPIKIIWEFKSQI